jgi:hypothetical protein
MTRRRKRTDSNVANSATSSTTTASAAVGAVRPALKKSKEAIPIEATSSASVESVAALEKSRESGQKKGSKSLLVARRSSARLAAISTTPVTVEHSVERNSNTNSSSSSSSNEGKKGMQKKNTKESSNSSTSQTSMDCNKSQSSSTKKNRSCVAESKEEAAAAAVATSSPHKRKGIDRPKGHNLMLQNIIRVGLIAPGTPLAFLIDNGRWWRGHVSHTQPYVIIDDTDSSLSGHKCPGPWIDAVKSRLWATRVELLRLQALQRAKKLIYEEVECERQKELLSNLEELDDLQLFKRKHESAFKHRPGTWQNVKAAAAYPLHFIGEGVGDPTLALHQVDEARPETWLDLSMFKTIYQERRAKLHWQDFVLDGVEHQLGTVVGELGMEQMEAEEQMTTFLTSALDFGLWIAKQSEELQHTMKQQEHSEDSSCSMCEDGGSHKSSVQILCQKLLTDLQRERAGGEEASAVRKLDASHPLFAFVSQNLTLDIVKSDAEDRTADKRTLSKNEQRIATLEKVNSQLKELQQKTAVSSSTRRGATSGSTTSSGSCSSTIPLPSTSRSEHEVEEEMAVAVEAAEIVVTQNSPLCSSSFLVSQAFPSSLPLAVSVSVPAPDFVYAAPVEAVTMPAPELITQFTDADLQSYLQTLFAVQAADCLPAFSQEPATVEYEHGVQQQEEEEEEGDVGSLQEINFRDAEQMEAFCMSDEIERFFEVPLPVADAAVSLEEQSIQFQQVEDMQVDVQEEEKEKVMRKDWKLDVKHRIVSLYDLFTFGIPPAVCQHVTSIG